MAALVQTLPKLSQPSHLLQPCSRMKGIFSPFFQTYKRLASITYSFCSRLTLKWVVPVSDVELVDGNSGGTLARMLHYGVGGGEGGGGGMLSGTTSVRERKRTSLTRTLTPSALLSGSSDTSPINGGVSAQGHQGHRGARAVNGGGAAEDLAQDMNNLMHDFDVISRISSLIGTLKGQYEVSSESIQSSRQLLYDDNFAGSQHGDDWWTLE